MKVDFDENIKIEIRDIISTIPSEFRKLNAGDQVGSFDELQIRVTNTDDFQCEIAFNNTILISSITIEMIWFFTYAHWEYYFLFCKGIKPDGQTLSLSHPDWDTPKSMLSTAKEKLTSQGDFIVKDTFPKVPNSDYEIGKVFKYTLLFFLSHELFHVKWNGKLNNGIKEEDNCDIDALRLMINSSSDNDYLLKAKGICLGLMILNIYGIHTNNFDGQTHPYSYDRLINNLSLFFGPENDKIWGFAVSIFALHMTEKQIKQPEKEFENFYDCILEYKNMFEQNKASS